MTDFASRVSRLIAGGFNAAVDAIENLSPDLVMEQAINEVEQAIEEVRAELGRATADGYLAAKKLATNSSRHEELSAQIEVAVEAGRDDLASAAISRQLDFEAQVAVLEQAVADAGERERELEGYIGALRGRHAEMREELKAYRARMAEQPDQAVLDAGGRPSSQHEINRSVDRAAASFDRASGHASDVLGTSPKNAAQLAELTEVVRSSEIEKRLAALKKRGS